MVLLYEHIINEYNHIFRLLYLLLNVDFLKLSFDLLKLLVKVHQFSLHLVFPLILEIALHMKIDFLHIFFVLLHIMYQMLVMIFQTQKVLLLLPFYLLESLNLYFLGCVLLHLLLLFYHS